MSVASLSQRLVSLSARPCSTRRIVNLKRKIKVVNLWKEIKNATQATTIMILPPLILRLSHGSLCLNNRVLFSHDVYG